jgi:hypothetical protein
MQFDGEKKKQGEEVKETSISQVSMQRSAFVMQDCVSNFQNMSKTMLGTQDKTGSFCTLTKMAQCKKKVIRRSPSHWLTKATQLQGKNTLLISLSRSFGMTS